MYKYKKPTTTTITHNTSYIGETIEQKVNRILNNKEPIKDGAPLIYTERKDGVQPQFDIRTDRFEIAVEAMDKRNRTILAKREERLKPKENTEQTPTNTIPRTEVIPRPNQTQTPNEGQA